MTTAVIVARAETLSESPACLLRLRGESIIGRLVGQLGRMGVGRIHVLTRAAWAPQITEAVPDAAVHTPLGMHRLFETVAAIAHETEDSLLIAYGELVMHDSVLVGLLLDPRVVTGILSSSASRYRRECTQVRLTRGRVVSAESPYHAVVQPTSAFLGLLKVAPADRPRMVAVARKLSSLCVSELPEKWEPELASKAEVWGRQLFARWTAHIALADQLVREGSKGRWLPDHEELRAVVDERFRIDVLQRVQVARDDVVSLLLTGLVRAGVVLHSVYLRELSWARPISQEAVDEAVREMEDVDEEAVLLQSAVKANDGFFTTYFVSPYSKYLARAAARRGLTPNQVTSISMLLGVAAAGAFVAGTRAGMVVGAVLLQAAFTADCVDGQLARYTRQFSSFGAWLDSVFDRGKEYLVYAGLAVGAVRGGGDPSVWVLAGAAIALQTFRHTLDFAFAAQQHQYMGEAPRAPLEEPDERAGAGSKRGWRASLRGGEDIEDDDAEGDAVGEDMEAAGKDTDQLLDALDSGPQSVRGQRPRRRAGSDRRQRRSALLSALGRAGVRTSVAFERKPWMRWAKKILVLPIGERFALISLTAALSGPRLTFTTLLVWGVVAGLYTGAGRILRSWV